MVEYNAEFFREKGRKGGRKTLRKYGKKHFIKLGKKKHEKNIIVRNDSRS